jgi:hypothetical protein
MFEHNQMAANPTVKPALVRIADALERIADGVERSNAMHLASNQQASDVMAQLKGVLGLEED